MHYLKYTHDLSDEAVAGGWVESPYWQYLSGMEFFRHEAPISPSTMSRWRSRVGEEGAGELLKETIECGLRTGAMKPSELRRVNVDTTVQAKHIRFPTDPRLFERMREKLVAAARREGLKLRQSYARVGKRLLARQSPSETRTTPSVISAVCGARLRNVSIIGAPPVRHGRFRREHFRRSLALRRGGGFRGMCRPGWNLRRRPGLRGRF